MSLIEKCLSDLDFRFDWYSATLYNDDEENYGVKILNRFLTRYFSLGTVGGGMHGYEKSVDFKHALLLFGGASGEHGAHVQLHGGELCQSAVEDFRANFPVHRVTRADVCVDFYEPGIFEKLDKICRSVAKKHGVQTRLYGDWIEAERGRTLYMGGKSSTHKMRLYEKGYEMRQKGTNPDASLNWVRLEFQVAPSRQTKYLASTMPPNEIAHSSRWTSDLSNRIGLSAGSGIKLSTQRTKNLVVTSLESMFHQYAKLIKQAVDEGHLSRDELIIALDECITTGKFSDFKMAFNPDNMGKPSYIDPSTGHNVVIRSAD